VYDLGMTTDPEPFPQVMKEVVAKAKPIPGTKPDKMQHLKQAIVDYLREHGPSTLKDMVRDIGKKYPAINYVLQRDAEVFEKVEKRAFNEYVWYLKGVVWNE
jgi:hypothetical protein